MSTDVEQAIQRGHPASNLFPMLSDAELWDLADDIGKQGLLEPIVVDQGLILDGRNRWVACVRSGCIPWTVPWDGEGGSATAYVISKNLKRRHLEPGQRAAIAAEALPLFEDEAEARRRELGRQAAQLQHHPQRVPEISPEPSEQGEAREFAAAQFDVNPRYVQDAKRLREHDLTTFEQLKAGAVTLPEAKRQSPAFVLSPAPEETPEQKGYYGLTRQRLLVRLDAEAVAAVCADPALSLDSFEDLSAWLSRFVDALRARVERPIRVVQ